MTDGAPHDETAEHAQELLARAREAVTERPELAGLLDRIERLDEVDLERHPELFEQVHQVLRTVLANAGDAPDPLPHPDDPSDQHAAGGA